MTALNLLHTQSQFGDAAPYTPTTFEEVLPTSLVATARNFANGLRVVEETDQYLDRKKQITDRFGGDYLPGINDEIRAEYPDIGAEGLLEQFESKLSARIVKGRLAEPEKWAGIQTKEEIDAESIRRGKLADEIASDIAARAPVGQRIAGQVIGSIGGAMTDPINLATLPLGTSASIGTLRAIRTEILLNAAIEAAQQPGIAEWQRKIGHKYGVGEAALDIGTAGLGAGVLTGIVRGGGPALRAIGDAMRVKSMPIFERMAMSPNLPSSVQNAAAYMGRIAHIDEEPMPGLREALEALQPARREPADAMPRGEKRADEPLAFDPARVTDRDVTIANRQNLQETQDSFRNYREPAYRIKEPPPAKNFDPGVFTNGRYADYEALRQGDRKFLEGAIAELQSASGGKRLFLESEGRGGAPKVIGYKSDAPEWFKSYNQEVTKANQERAKIKKLNEKLPQEKQKPLPPSRSILTRKKAADVAKKLLNKLPLGKEEAQIAKSLLGVARDSREENIRQMLSYRENRTTMRAAEDEKSIDALAAREAAAIEADLITRPTDALLSMQRDVEALEDGGLEAAFNADFARLLKEQPDLKILTETGEKTLKEIADEIKENEAILAAIKTCAIGKS